MGDLFESENKKNPVWPWYSLPEFSHPSNHPPSCHIIAAVKGSASAGGGGPLTRGLSSSNPMACSLLDVNEWPRTASHLRKATKANHGVQQEKGAQGKQRTHEGQRNLKNQTQKQKAKASEKEDNAQRKTDKVLKKKNTAQEMLENVFKINR